MRGLRAVAVLRDEGVFGVDFFAAAVGPRVWLGARPVFATGFEREVDADWVALRFVAVGFLPAPCCFAAGLVGAALRADTGAAFVVDLRVAAVVADRLGEVLLFDPATGFVDALRFARTAALRVVLDFVAEAFFAAVFFAAAFLAAGFAGTAAFFLMASVAAFVGFFDFVALLALRADAGLSRAEAERAIARLRAAVGRVVAIVETPETRSVIAIPSLRTESEPSRKIAQLAISS